MFTPTALCCSWLYVDGTDPKTINPDPWQYNGFEDYNHGTKLKDESCKPMAAYMARLVGHYTAGGHHDDVRTPAAFPSFIPCPMLINGAATVRPLARVWLSLQLDRPQRAQRGRVSPLPIRRLPP